MNDYCNLLVVAIFARNSGTACNCSGYPEGVTYPSPGFAEPKQGYPGSDRPFGSNPERVASRTGTIL